MGEESGNMYNKVWQEGGKGVGMRDGKADGRGSMG